MAVRLVGRVSFVIRRFGLSVLRRPAHRSSGSSGSSKARRFVKVLASGLPSVARFKHTRRMQEQDRSLRAALQSSASRGDGSGRSNPGAWSNPSIERTFQRPLRALWPAAHVKR